jgi:hypothetical protein
VPASRLAVVERLASRVATSALSRHIVGRELAGRGVPVAGRAGPGRGGPGGAGGGGAGRVGSGWGTRAGHPGVKLLSKKSDFHIDQYKPARRRS